MRCSDCGENYSVAWAQPSPGGSAAPGVLARVAIGLVFVAGVLFRLDVDYAPWVSLAIAGFVGVQVLVAWSDCRRSGGACPKCGTEHPVRPWST